MQLRALQNPSSTSSVRKAFQRQRAALNALQDALALESTATLRWETAFEANGVLLSAVCAATEALVHDLPGAGGAAFDGALGEASLLDALGFVELHAHRLIGTFAATYLSAAIAPAGGDQNSQLISCEALTTDDRKKKTFPRLRRSSIVPALIASTESAAISEDAKLWAAAEDRDSEAQNHWQRASTAAASAILGSGPVAPLRGYYERLLHSAPPSDSMPVVSISPLSNAQVAGGVDASSSDVGDDPDGAFLRPINIYDIRRKAEKGMTFKPH